ncbi:MAG TPA: hypothetical protein VN729_08770, partial [Ktedonobacteraceae bacterium]|nr:hypothetical protein [Ktedonobacteraceae bacterium]
MELLWRRAPIACKETKSEHGFERRSRSNPCSLFVSLQAIGARLHKSSIKLFSSYALLSYT